MKVLVLYFSLFLIFSCTKQSSPEGVLRGFVDYRFNEGQIKEDILGALDGVMKEKIEKMDEEELKTFFDVKNFKKKNFKVVSKNCVNPEKCFLTYIVRYSQSSEDLDAEFDVEVKKIAEIVVADETWKITDIRDVKTYIDSSTPLTPQN